MRILLTIPKPEPQPSPVLPEFKGEITDSALVEAFSTRAAKARKSGKCMFCDEPTLPCSAWCKLCADLLNQGGTFEIT